MRQSAKELYAYWLNSAVIDEASRQELAEIAENDSEIEERFYRDLEFGTGGMRGIIGAGTNRMNIYTVRRASQGLADYVIRQNGEQAGVVIGYDTRYFSDIFAQETAKVLLANNIRVYLFDCVHATPEVSFAIRYYHAAAGVMITASHNPKEYNGYKAYGADGAQFPPEASDVIVAAINGKDIFQDVRVADSENWQSNSLLQMIGQEVDQAFLDAVCAQRINPDAIASVAEDFRLVYTPFHGTGLRPVTQVFERIGLKHVIVEPQQAKPDPSFPTVKSPNPEDREGFSLAIALAKKHNASLIIGTDPDADRVGVVVRDANGEYQTLTGNQTGALLCEYILSSKKEKGLLKPDSTIIKTIVTSELAQAIADAYDVHLINVLTGFKYIAEKIAGFEQSGKGVYEFGFEESYGYLPGTYARDKDAVGASMLIAEMAAVYQAKHMTLYDALMQLYQKYGFYREQTVSVVMPGKDGMQKMADIMQSIRTNLPDEFGGIGIETTQDYLNNTQYNSDGSTQQIGDFPSSNVLKFKLADKKTFVVIRPSGTEPKIKLYIGTAAETAADAESQMNYLSGAMRSYLAF